MYASIENSTYVENTVTVNGALSHKHTMNATLPNLEAGSITTADFLTSFLVVDGDPILVFGAENVNGIEDVAGTVVDNLDGTWTVPFTATFISAPTSVHMLPALSDVPSLEVQAEVDDARIIMIEETLVFVSATDVQMVASTERSGMLSIGDTITISDGITPTDVVLTSISEAGTIPAITLTMGYATSIIATSNATVAPRATEVTAISMLRANTPSTDVVIKYANTVNVGQTWNRIARKIVSHINWTITEPLTMDYTEEIVLP